jgi:hypothetical protein
MHQANAASPLYSELLNIVLKTVGLAEPLRDALKPLSSAIRAAFVYGSVAKATDQSASDIDLMIISDSLTYGEVFGGFERVTRGRPENQPDGVHGRRVFKTRSRTKSSPGTYLLYDGACDTGGMLTVAEDTLRQLAAQHGKQVATHLYGQEINAETYAICQPVSRSCRH